MSVLFIEYFSWGQSIILRNRGLRRLQLRCKLAKAQGGGGGGMAPLEKNLHVHNVFTQNVAKMSTVVYSLKNDPCPSSQRHSTTKH